MGLQSQDGSLGCVNILKRGRSKQRVKRALLKVALFVESCMCVLLKEALFVESLSCGFSTGKDLIHSQRSEVSIRPCVGISDWGALS